MHGSPSLPSVLAHRATEPRYSLLSSIGLNSSHCACASCSSSAVRNVLRNASKPAAPEFFSAADDEPPQPASSTAVSADAATACILLNMASCWIAMRVRSHRPTGRRAPVPPHPTHHPRRDVATRATGDSQVGSERPRPYTIRTRSRGSRMARFRCRHSPRPTDAAPSPDRTLKQTCLHHRGREPRTRTRRPSGRKTRGFVFAAV